ncbi:MAG TPA: complex I NDUFA9 subunit family protein [Candidatus Angelobacter sp.]|nr:complex I NDUFA9 subunit family protein [Candidatus Angelobacter sp.]
MARIAITGGTGFVGLHTARALTAAGHELRLVSRGRRGVPRRDGVQFARADVVTGTGLVEALAGCDAVVHLAAVIRERGAQTFDNVNRLGAENVGKAARQAGVGHIVHLSALGADPDPDYPYLASKWAGEAAMLAAGVPVDVLRPSLMFGPGDGFFTKLVKLIRWNPVTPVPGDGTATFQPFAVVDLAQIVVQCVERGPRRLVAEVGGPEWLTLDEIIDVIKGVMGSHRRNVHVPVMALLPAAIIFDKLLSNPPVTPNQLKMLERRNTTHPQAVQRQFGFEPLSFPDNAEYLQDY